MPNLLTIVECPKCKQLRMAVFDDNTAVCEHVTVHAYPAFTDGLFGRTYPPKREHISCGFKARVVEYRRDDAGSIWVQLAYPCLRLPSVDKVRA